MNEETFEESDELLEELTKEDEEDLIGEEEGIEDRK